jgi:hypothetical protein
MQSIAWYSISRAQYSCPCRVLHCIYCKDPSTSVHAEYCFVHYLKSAVLPAMQSIVLIFKELSTPAYADHCTVFKEPSLAGSAEYCPVYKGPNTAGYTKYWTVCAKNSCLAEYCTICREPMSKLLLSMHI